PWVRGFVPSCLGVTLPPLRGGKGVVLNSSSSRYARARGEPPGDASGDASPSSPSPLRDALRARHRRDLSRPSSRLRSWASSSLYWLQLWICTPSPSSRASQT